MLDWNGNGSRDNFDRHMDYHIMNESSQGYGKSSSSDSIFRGTGLIYWLICAFAIETILMNLILDVEDGGIVSLLLAIPVSKFVISLDRKLGKWDKPSESVSQEDMKPWQYRLMCYLVFLFLYSFVCILLPDSVWFAIHRTVDNYAVVIFLGLIVLSSELLMWFIMRDEKKQRLASTSVVTSTMPKPSDCSVEATNLRGERLAELSECVGQFALKQDIQATDYGKVIRMGRDAFIFRAIPRHGNKHVNQQCVERNALIYWVKGQRTVLGLDELVACELVISGERVEYCMAKSVESMEALVGNRYIPRPYNGFTIFTTDGNSRAITIYAPQELLQDAFNILEYVITPTFRQTPFGVITTHDC